MFGVGWTEILVILVVALLVLGPTKLPDIAKGLGKGLRDFRKAMSSLEDDPSEQQPPRPAAWSTPTTPPSPPEPPPPAAIQPGKPAASLPSGEAPPEATADTPPAERSDSRYPKT